VAGEIALLVNPTAGKGRGARLGARTAAALREAGLPAALLVGRDAVEASDQARTALDRGACALVVVGGDGMVHLGVQLVAGTEVPLGVVPAGTGNDFVRSLGQRHDRPDEVLAGLVEALRAPTVRKVDAARVGAEWFACVLSAGFDSMVNERANRMRWPRGHLRYDLSMVLELPVFRPLPFTIELSDGPDGPQVVETDAMLVAVGNTPSYGGGMRICPSAAVDDGLLDLTVVGPISKATLIRIFPQVYSGRHVLHPAVSTYRARRVSLAAPGVTTYADGEPIAPLPLTVEAVPAALRVLVPPVGG
jgi:diacylglycerol kinase (ATP)